MELIVSISNWSYFFINIIEIHFFSFFFEKESSTKVWCEKFAIRGI